MEPPPKRARHHANAFEDASPTTGASPRTRHDTPHSFSGMGLQNSGATRVGRDLNIQKFSFHVGRRIEEDEKSQILLKSLHFDQMDARQWNIKKSHAHTCEWILRSSAYSAWTMRRRGHNFLWLIGKPGTGKSTLMKFLLLRLRHRIRQTKSEEVLMSFFFNARGHDLERTTAGVYRAFLLQLLEQRPDLRDQVFEDIRIGHNWTNESLKFIFERAVQCLNASSIVCLIDALDECDESQARDLVSFFDDLGEARDGLFICFAMRHYPRITIAAGLSLVLEHQVGHDEDIASYLDSALRIGSNKDAERMRSDLRAKALGVFTWVVLVVAIINKEYDAGREHDLYSQIQGLPGDLYQLFHDILTRDGHSSSKLLLCVQWLLFAHEPLKPKQLYYAIISGEEPHNLSRCHSADISADTVERYILNCSKGVAETTNPKIPTVQFFHESVRDFLLADNGIGRIWPDLSSNALGQSHEALKQCCLAYVGMEELEGLETRDPEKTLRKFPFLEHAHHGILYHAEQAQSRGVDQGGFLHTFPRIRWINIHNVIVRLKRSQMKRGTYTGFRYTLEASLLYILAEAGYPELIRAHPTRQSCFEVESERYGPPILAACLTNHMSAVYTMLELQSNRLPHFSFSLFLEQWSSDIGKSQKSGKAHSVDDLPFKSGELLYWLIKYANEQVSVFFVETERADMGWKDRHGRTLLMHASSEGFDVLVELLLHKGSGISSRDEKGWTALHHAAYRGRTRTARLLVEGGANVSTPNSNGWTPLHCASEGHSETAEVLVNHGADLSLVSNDGWTPFHYALYRGHLDVAKLLVSRGADVLAVGKYGFIPLQYALDRKYLEVAKLLIHHGANVSTVIKDGCTLLHYTSLNGYTEIAELLIDRGADISAVDMNGWTPLHHASYGGFPEVVELLIDRGATVSVVDRLGHTPLDNASSQGHTKVVALLSDKETGG